LAQDHPAAELHGSGKALILQQLLKHWTLLRVVHPGSPTSPAGRPSPCATGAPPRGGAACWSAAGRSGRAPERRERRRRTRCRPPEGAGQRRKAGSLLSIRGQERGKLSSSAAAVTRAKGVPPARSTAHPQQRHMAIVAGRHKYVAARRPAAVRGCGLVCRRSREQRAATHVPAADNAGAVRGGDSCGICARPGDGLDARQQLVSFNWVSM
jgi:hypothetical protein